METLLAAGATTMAASHESVRAPTRTTSDDLTNLSWVAGTPVPMNTSVSPPEGIMFSKKINNNNNNSGLQTRTENTTSTTKSMKRLFKAPLPTYKIIVKDHSDYSVSSNGSSPDRDDCAVIFANVMSEQPSDYDLNGSLDFDYLLDKVIPGEDGETDDDVCVINDLPDQEEGGSFPNGESKKEKVKSHSKPNCSYTCLIGMALKASNGCLPVNAIYQYIEKEFPYFVTAPDGWKNSVRHNLSLNPIFRKVNPEGWFGKKGHLWEVCLNKQHLVNKEIQRYLHSTGKTLNKFSVPLKGCYARTKLNTKKQLYRSSGNNLVKSPVLCSRCTMIVSPTPDDSFTSSDDSSKQKETETEVNKYCPDMKEEVKFCGVQVKPKMQTTESALDPSVGPLRYGGFQPTNDVTSPEHMFSPMSYPVPFVPFYPQPAHFGIPLEGTPPTCHNSSSSTSSTPSPLGNPMAAYAMPVPYQYMMWGHYAQFYNSMLSREMIAGNEFNGIPQMIPAADRSVKVLSSSGTSADVLNGDFQNTSPQKRAPNHDNTTSSPDIICLNSPPKRMKAGEGGLLAESLPDKNVSSYLADISSNDIFSDSDQATDDEVHHSTMNARQSPFQQRNQSEGSGPLSNLSPQAKKGLEQIVGDSDLSALLTNGYKSIAEVAKIAEVKHSDDNSLPLEKKLIGGKEEVECVSSMDLHDIDSRVSSSQKDPYYLPRLDSLLHIGDDTIMSIKTAMNLDIQGTVEVRTANDKCKKIQEEMQETNSLKYNV